MSSFSWVKRFVRQSGQVSVVTKQHITWVVILLTVDCSNTSTPTAKIAERILTRIGSVWSLNVSDYWFLLLNRSFPTVSQIWLSAALSRLSRWYLIGSIFSYQKSGLRFLRHRISTFDQSEIAKGKTTFRVVWYFLNPFNTRNLLIYHSGQINLFRSFSFSLSFTFFSLSLLLNKNYISLEFSSFPPTNYPRPTSPKEIQIEAHNQSLVKFVLLF